MPLMRAYLHEAGSEVHALMTLGQRPDCSVVFVLVAVFVLKAVVLSSASQAKGTGRGLPLGEQLWRRLLAAGRARVRPGLLPPLLPARGSLPRLDTGTVTRLARGCGPATPRTFQYAWARQHAAREQVRSGPQGGLKAGLG